MPAEVWAPGDVGERRQPPLTSSLPDDLGLPTTLQIDKRALRVKRGFTYLAFLDGVRSRCDHRVGVHFSAPA
jgi:hypothetical protein